MKALLATAIVVTGALLAGGCATKRYVHDSTAPIQAKVDQVGDQTTQNSQQIQSTKSDLKQLDEKATNGITPPRSWPPPPTTTPPTPIGTRAKPTTMPPMP